MARPRVLLVSAADRRNRLIDALEAADCTVQTVETATAALGRLSTEAYDCLVSEYLLPGDDGLALRAAVRRLAPDLPFVLVADPDADHAVSVGSDCDNYVRFDGDGAVDRLVTTVHSCSDAADAPMAARVDDSTETTADREEFRRLCGRLDGLFGALSGVVVGATDRTELEHQVCKTVAAEPEYTAAWIGSLCSDDTEIESSGGRLDPSTTTLQLSTASGLSTSTPVTIRFADLPSAVRRAVETGSSQRFLGSTNGVFDPEAGETRWQLVVPLWYGERRYGLFGVGGVGAAEPWERPVGSSLGAMIGAGLHAVETSHVLTADHVTELRIDLHDDSFQLVEIAAAVSGPVERYGTTGTDGDRELYLTTEAAVDPERLMSLSFITAVRIISETETVTTLSTAVSTVAPDESLAELGAVVTEATATADSASLRIEIPQYKPVRPLLETLRAQYDTVELRGRTDRECRDQHPAEFVAAVDRRLTECQQAALRAAQLNGYFEWPRPVDGREIAATMDITRQTFHQHLRAAERKLVATYLDAR